jgi:nitroreductase
MDLHTVDTLLATTRTVRKRLDFDRPVEREVIERCLTLALQAPTGSNAQGWHFMVITDPEKKTAVSELYRKSFFMYANTLSEQPRQRYAPADQMQRVVSSSVYLANNMHRAPVLVIPCIEGRVENAGQMAQAGLYGSILPATWSFMLALRARGLGAAWTTLHLRYEKETAEILGLPQHVTQAALLPVAYYTGDTFQPANRRPLAEVIHWDSWE